METPQKILVVLHRCNTSIETEEYPLVINSFIICGVEI